MIALAPGASYSLFSGSACFSPSVDSATLNAWSTHGGSIARTLSERRAADFYFSCGPDDPWVSILSSKGLVIFDVAWIEHAVAEQFRMPMRAYVLDDIPVIPAEQRTVEGGRVLGFSGRAASARSKAHPASPSTSSDASPSPPRAAGKRRIQEFQETDSPPQTVRPRKRVRVDDADARGQSPMTPERPTSETKAAGGSRASEDSHFSLDSALGFGTPSEASPMDKAVVGRTHKLDLRKLARRAGHASGRLARTVLSPFKIKSTKLGNGELARLHDLTGHLRRKVQLVQEQTLSETEPCSVAKATTPTPAIASSPLALSHLDLTRTTPPGQMSPQSDASRAPAPAWTSPVRFRAEAALPRDVEGVFAALEDVSIRDVCAHEHGKMHPKSQVSLSSRTGAAARYDAPQSAAPHRLVSDAAASARSSLHRLLPTAMVRRALAHRAHRCGWCGTPTITAIVCFENLPSLPPRSPPFPLTA